MAAVEKTTRYVTHVHNLSDAWAFIMDHIEEVDSAPTIRIDPRWILKDDPRDDDDEERVFVVAVSGTTSEPRD